MPNHHEDEDYGLPLLFRGIGEEDTGDSHSANGEAMPANVTVAVAVNSPVEGGVPTVGAVDEIQAESGTTTDRHPIEGVQSAESVQESEVAVDNPAHEAVAAPAAEVEIAVTTVETIITNNPVEGGSGGDSSQQEPLEQRESNVQGATLDMTPVQATEGEDRGESFDYEPTDERDVNPVAAYRSDEDSVESEYERVSQVSDFSMTIGDRVTGDAGDLADLDGFTIDVYADKPDAQMDDTHVAEEDVSMRRRNKKTRDGSGTDLFGEPNTKEDKSGTAFSKTEKRKRDSSHVVDFGDPNPSRRKRESSHVVDFGDPNPSKQHRGATSTGVSGAPIVSPAPNSMDSVYAESAALIGAENVDMIRGSIVGYLLGRAMANSRPAGQGSNDQAAQQSSPQSPMPSQHRPSNVDLRPPHMRSQRGGSHGPTDENK